MDIDSTTTKPSKIAAYFKLGRFKFLIYSSLSYTFGTTFCLYLGYDVLSLTKYIIGLVAVWLIHLMTHYCNEFYDLEADRANLSFTKWTGGSRVLVEGLLKPKTSIAIGYILLFVVLFMGIILLKKLSLLIVLSGLFFGWFYTAPPFAFNYNRLGELSVAITLVFLVPLLGFVIQTDTIPVPMIVILVPAFIIQFARMMIMNLSDYEGDVIVKKETLVTYLKPKKSIIVYGIAHVIAYALLIPFYAYHLLPLSVAITVALTIPISLWQYFRIKKGGYKNRETANSIVFWASTHSVLVILTIYTGIVIDLIINHLNEASMLTTILLLCAVPPLLYLFLMISQIRKNR